MNAEFRKIISQMLADKLQAVRDIRQLIPPSGGWLRAIRLALGMPSRYPAKKMGLTAQGFRDFEKNEASGAISLKSLRRAADAMNCDLIYAIVPRSGSLQSTIEKQALKQAKAMVLPVAHSMLLESQSTDSSAQRIQELAQRLAAEPKASLWNET